MPKPNSFPEKDFFDTYQEAILIASDKDEFVYANTCFVNLTGFKLYELDHAFKKQLFAKSAPAQGGVANVYRIMWLTKRDGAVIRLRISESLIRLSDLSPGRCFTLVPFATDSENAGAKKFYELADASPAMIFLQDKNGMAHYFNKAWLEFTGKPASVQFNTRWEALVHPDDLKILKDNRADIIDRRSYISEYRLLKFDGDYRNLYAIGTPVISEDGIFEGYMSSCLDITEMKDAQNEIARLTHQLSVSHEELEQFTYVTSHDLMEPLRMITGYIQLIQKNIEKGNLGVINEFMEFVLSGTIRMQALIADILQLSRVTRKGAPFAAVDMKETLAVAIAHLAKKIKATNAKITYGDMPTVTGDTFQLVSLFENLLDNALKFTPLTTPPDITVKAEEKHGKYIFEVKDNGTGIDNKFHKRIFAIFQRLHTRGEYEGTGIGLAVSKKIVERHGGEIWVESEPGNGSTFYFSIKK